MRYRFLIYTVLAATIALFFFNNAREVDSTLRSAFYSAPWYTAKQDAKSFKTSIINYTYSFPQIQKSKLMQRVSPIDDEKQLREIWTFLQLYTSRYFTDKEWNDFLSTGNIPPYVSEHIASIDKAKENKEKATSEQRLRLEKQSQVNNFGFYFFTASSLAFFVSFSRENKHLIAKVTLLKNIVLAGNSILVLIAAVLFEKHEGIALSLALIVCSIVNAVIVIRGFNNPELDRWSSYTVNALLMLIAFHLYNRSHDVYSASIMIMLMSMINFYYHRKKTSSISS